MSKKYKKLVLSIILDIIGYLTIFPLDFIWAPVTGYLMTKMYKGTIGKAAGIFSFLEEIIPFTDVIPSFSIMWVYTYVIKKEDKEEETVIIDI